MLIAVPRCGIAAKPHLASCCSGHRPWSSVVSRANQTIEWDDLRLMYMFAINWWQIPLWNRSCKDGIEEFRSWCMETASRFQGPSLRILIGSISAGQIELEPRGASFPRIGMEETMFLFEPY